MLSGHYTTDLQTRHGQSLLNISCLLNIPEELVGLMWALLKHALMWEKVYSQIMRVDED
jgi:hypothetical protein